MELIILSQGATFSPIELFLQADWVVKAVMIGLTIASVWVWTIIIGFLFRMSRIFSETGQFEAGFAKTGDLDGFYKEHGKSDLPIARVFAAGLTEWRRSTAVRSPDRQGTRERLATAMDASIAAESEKLSNRLNFHHRRGCAFCRAVRHRLGYHAQLFCHCRRAE
jgi:biopolymer transport protein TolQ